MAHKPSNRRKTAKDYHALAQKKGFKWLGPEVPNVITKTTWLCKKGHQWQATYNSIRQGYGCPVCSNNIRKIPIDYHALAEKKGFKWLGPEVPNVVAKTTWQCSKGHQWQARFSSIQAGGGCPACHNRVSKTPQDFHTLAKKRGFKWLGPEVPITKTKTTWQCNKGHKWQAGFKNIKQGANCPFCSSNAPKTPQDYHTLAKKRGFKWMGPTVSNSITKTIWQCQQGHYWQSSYANIRHGRGCRVCGKCVPKTPQDYHALAEKRGFKWLGPEVPNTRTKTTWQCEQGHSWQTPFKAIRQGRGCRECYYETLRKHRKKKPKLIDS